MPDASIKLSTLLWRWDSAGLAMRPVGPYGQRDARRAFVDGETYLLSPMEQRSLKSHNHYFAELGDLYANLPEGFDEDVPSMEHMRKWGLIRTGWRNDRVLSCTTHAKALKLAAYIRGLADSNDRREAGLSIVTVNGKIVIHSSAKTQQFNVMGKADFQKSKDDVLGYWRQRIAEHWHSHQPPVTVQIAPPRRRAPVEENPFA